MTAKMALRKKTHRGMSAAKIVDVMPFCADQLTLYVLAKLFGLVLIICIFEFMSISPDIVFAVTSKLWVLKETKAEIVLLAHEASARDDRGAYEMPETAELCYNANITSCAEKSLEYYFTFPDGNSDVGYGPRRRSRYANHMLHGFQFFDHIVPPFLACAGAYEMSETAELCYNTNITCSDESLEYYFTFPDGNSDVGYGPRRRSRYDVEAYRITELLRELCDLLEMFETLDIGNGSNETTNITSRSDGEYGCTKMVFRCCFEVLLEAFAMRYCWKSTDAKGVASDPKSVAFDAREIREQSLVLVLCDAFDAPTPQVLQILSQKRQVRYQWSQDAKFQKCFKGFHGVEIRTTQHDNIESANRVQTRSILESFDDGSEITTGPSHQGNWIPRLEYHHSLDFIVVVLILSYLILSDLRALRRSSHGSGSSAWMESSMKATHGFEPDQSTPVQGEMPDDAVDLMEPLLRDQIKIALEPVLGPVTAALLHQGREERTQRQKLIAMEEQKLALKKKKVRCLKRRRACRLQLIRRALPTKSPGDKSTKLTDLPLQLQRPPC